MSPAEQNVAFQRALDIEAQPSEILLNTARAQQAGRTPTFEQAANLQLANTALNGLLRRATASGRGQIVSLNEGPEGERTSARDRHAWLINPQTGERIAYLGPNTSPDPVGGTGSIEDRRFFNIEKTITSEVAKQMALEGKGTLITLPDGSNTINFKEPAKDLIDYKRRVGTRIRFEKEKDRLPADWHEPDTQVRVASELARQQGRVVTRPTGDVFIMPDGDERPIMNVSTVAEAQRLPNGTVVRFNGQLGIKNETGIVDLGGF